MTIHVHHGDAMALAPEDFAFDVLITDPPYSPHVHANTASMGSAGEGPTARDLGFSALSVELRTHLARTAKQVKRWSVLFSDLEGTWAWRESVKFAGAEYIREVPWVRWSQPQLSGDRPPSGAEAVLLFHAKGAKRWNGAGSLTHFSQRCLRGAGKHPTEKPLDLMLAIVSAFSDPGETVADPCAGSGTTALACRLLGRGCFAVEMDERWAAHTQTRATGPLSDRDREHAEEWCVTTHEEAARAPEPKAVDGSDVRTWERAQRRLADVARVAEWL